VQDRRPADGLARRAPHPLPLRADYVDVHAPGRGRPRARRPGGAPLLHPDRGRSHDVRAGAGVPTARRYRPPAAEVVEAHADAVLALIFRR
jgi:hypothetical protein